MKSYLVVQHFGTQLSSEELTPQVVCKKESKEDCLEGESKLKEVKDAIENDNIEEKFKYINKSIAIFDELRNILDFEGGDVAYYLDGLYLYQIETLFSAGIDNNLTSIEQVTKVVKGLIEAWKEETGL